jgi:hypothetical protein
VSSVVGPHAVFVCLDSDPLFIITLVPPGKNNERDERKGKSHQRTKKKKLQHVSAPFFSPFAFPSFLFSETFFFKNSDVIMTSCLTSL